MESLEELGIAVNEFGLMINRENKNLSPRISIITPVYNEELNVKNCAHSLRSLMMSKLPQLDYEHIFADNSSEDQTVSILKEIAKTDPHVKIIVNSRNVGIFRNMWNALKSATGDAVIPFLPADLQDPVEVIPSFIENWQSGFLVVYGVRKNRQESRLMRVLRNFYYQVIWKFSEAKIPRNVGEFLLADRKIINSILELDDQYPYIRGLIAQTCVPSKEVEYTWVARKQGKSKISFFQLVDQAINGLISTSRVPARIALTLGFLFSALGFLGALASLLMILFGNQQIFSGIPTIVISIFLFSGLQLLFIGLVGEYVLSIHSQVRPSPRMFEVERINFT